MSKVIKLPLPQLFKDLPVQKKPKRTLGVYKSYNFVDKDPIIDEVRTVIEDTATTYAHIERDSGVTTQTLRNWFQGETKRPQAATVRAVLRTMGFDLGIVRHMNEPTIREVLLQALDDGPKTYAQLQAILEARGKSASYISMLSKLHKEGLIKKATQPTGPKLYSRKTNRD